MKLHGPDPVRSTVNPGEHLGYLNADALSTSGFTVGTQEMAQEALVLSNVEKAPNFYKPKKDYVKLSMMTGENSGTVIVGRNKHLILPLGEVNGVEEMSCFEFYKDGPDELPSVAFGHVSRRELNVRTVEKLLRQIAPETFDTTSGFHPHDSRYFLHEVAKNQDWTDQVLRSNVAYLLTQDLHEGGDPIGVKSADDSVLYNVRNSLWLDRESGRILKHGSWNESSEALNFRFITQIYHTPVRDLVRGVRESSLSAQVDHLQQIGLSYGAAFSLCAAIAIANRLEKAAAYLDTENYASGLPRHFFPRFR